MPEKEAEAEPWDRLCVDLIGPYTIRHKGKQPLRMQCCTMIDPATGWFEIAQYDDKRAITIAQHRGTILVDTIPVANTNYLFIEVANS